MCSKNLNKLPFGQILTLTHTYKSCMIEDLENPHLTEVKEKHRAVSVNRCICPQWNCFFFFKYKLNFKKQFKLISVGSAQHQEEIEMDKFEMHVQMCACIATETEFQFDMP